MEDTNVPTQDMVVHLRVPIQDMEGQCNKHQAQDMEDQHNQDPTRVMEDQLHHKDHPIVIIDQVLHKDLQQVTIDLVSQDRPQDIVGLDLPERSHRCKCQWLKILKATFLPQLQVV